MVDSMLWVTTMPFALPFSLPVLATLRMKYRMISALVAMVSGWRST